MGANNKVVCYGKSGNRLLKAVHDGAEAIGLSPVFLRPETFCDPQDCTMAVVVNMVWQSRKILAAYRKKGTPVLVLDAGYIFRNRGYYQIGINGLNGLPVSAPHGRAADMGLIAKDHKPGHHILVCGQKPGDNQHDIDVGEWQDRTLATLERYTSRPVYYRPHPGVEKPTRTLPEVLTNCHCMVTHNSTAAYEAIMAGVPVICDPCAVYASVCETDIAWVENPSFGSEQSRQRLLDRVAHGQWTIDEIRTGEPLKFYGGA